jgi:hypothetical protein
MQGALYYPWITGEIHRRCLAYGVDMRTCPPLGLRPALMAAHRALMPAGLKHLAEKLGVTYAVLEREFFLRASWPAQSIVYENPSFVVVRST